MGLTDQVPPTGSRRSIVDGHLCGSRCPSCAASSWPGRGVCFRCGTLAEQDVAFPREGELLTHSTVWVPRPGIEAPYTLGQVRLRGGPTVFAHVRGLPQSPAVPIDVVLVTGEPDATPTFWFRPLEDS